MNTKRSTISKFKLLYLIALLVATTISTTTIPISHASEAASASGSGTGTIASTSYIEHEEDRQVLSVDSNRAISLATSSQVFQARIGNAQYQFNSIYEEFSWSPAAATPSVVMNTVNVVYSQRNTNGTGNNVVAVENPRLTMVVDVTVQSGLRMRNQHNSGNWDGWEFQPYWVRSIRSHS